MSKHIFFDLDGTLLDPKLRLFQLFHSLAPECTLSFAEYWDLKRNQLSQRDMLRQHLKYSPEAIEQFRIDWMNQVEDEQRLAMDTPIEGVQLTLDSLHGNFNMYVVTARQHAQRAENQLLQLGWMRYFQGVLVTQQAQSKAALVRANVQTEATDIFVGDTCEDVQTGKTLGIRTIAVCSGTLAQSHLCKCGPDLILESIAPPYWQTP